MNKLLTWTLTLALFSCASSAHAQDATWTEPGGRFSLAFPGWTALPDDRATVAGDMIIITRNDSLRDHRPRICAISQRPPHDLDSDQEAANAHLDRVTAADVEHNVGQPVSNFTHAMRGNVATIDYGVTLNGNQMRTRDFVLAGNGQMIVFDITCGAPAPLTGDETASIAAVLDTLTIASHPQASAPHATGVVGWELRSPSPGAPPCRAVKLGSAVDTQLLRNRDGHLVLIAGHGDWAHDPHGPTDATLSIDDGPAIAVSGVPIGPIFMTLIADEQLAQLRNARAIRWHLPWGEFTADVSGLGAAFDAIGICPG